ncbi:MAG: hypothetical protein WC408_04910 [Candidatus Micrarchaeia archaeon]|jgi:hypothetical protein
MAHIKGEPQALFRKTAQSKMILGSSDRCWFSEQRNMYDPVTFFDIFVRGENFDQYFYWVIALLVFGLLLM